MFESKADYSVLPKLLTEFFSQVFKTRRLTSHFWLGPYPLTELFSQGFQTPLRPVRGSQKNKNSIWLNYWARRSLPETGHSSLFYPLTELFSQHIIIINANEEQRSYGRDDGQTLWIYGKTKNPESPFKPSSTGILSARNHVWDRAVSSDGSKRIEEPF